MKARKIKRLIRQEIKRRAEQLGLADWDFTLRFCKVESPVGTPESWQSCACCEAMWQYRVARLSFDSRGMSKYNWSKKDIRDAVLHELVHCLVDGIHRSADYTVLERTVCDLERAIAKGSEAP